MAEEAGGYRGTTLYARVLAELVQAAQYRGVTTYQDIALIMELPTTGQRMGREVGEMLDEISSDEVRAGRPMLSAVAVNTEGRPGSGFYRLAARLERAESGEADAEFWARERDAVYEAWKRPIR